MKYNKYNKKVMWNQRELDIYVIEQIWPDSHVDYRTGTKLVIEGSKFVACGYGSSEEQSIANCIRCLIDDIKACNAGNKVKIVEDRLNSDKKDLQKAIETQKVAAWLVKQFNL